MISELNASYNHVVNAVEEYVDALTEYSATLGSKAPMSADMMKTTAEHIGEVQQYNFQLAAVHGETVRQLSGQGSTALHCDNAIDYLADIYEGEESEKA